MDCVTCINSYLKHLSGSCDFGGFLLLGVFKRVFEVFGLFLLLSFGLKVLKIIFLCDFGGKSGTLGNGICAKNDFDGKCNSKITSCKCMEVTNVHNLSAPVIDKLEITELLNCDADGYNEATNVYRAECVDDNDDGEDDENKHYDEDKEFDVLALRKMIKIERCRGSSALLELEKERMSAATAVEESMAMILRLQNEKSLIEMEYNQYRRLTEEKLHYDQQVIQSLQWLVTRHESDRTFLEERWRLCQQKLSLFMKSDEMGQFQEVEASFSSFKASFEDALDHSLSSLHDLDLSPE